MFSVVEFNNHHACWCHIVCQESLRQVIEEKLEAVRKVSELEVLSFALSQNCSFSSDLRETLLEHILVDHA